MADETDNLVLGLLRRIEAKLDVVATDLAETIASADRCLARLAVVERGLDRLEGSLDRIEANLHRTEQRRGATSTSLGVFGARPSPWQRGL